MYTTQHPALQQLQQGARLPGVRARCTMTAAAALLAAREAVAAASSGALTGLALRAGGGLRPTMIEAAATVGIITGAHTKVAGDSGGVPEGATGSISPYTQECQQQ